MPPWLRPFQRTVSVLSELPRCLSPDGKCPRTASATSSWLPWAMGTTLRCVHVSYNAACSVLCDTLFCTVPRILNGGVGSGCCTRGLDARLLASMLESMPLVLPARPCRMLAQVSFVSHFKFLCDADLIELTGLYLTSLTVISAQCSRLVTACGVSSPCVVSPCLPLHTHHTSCTPPRCAPGGVGLFVLL